MSAKNVSRQGTSNLDPSQWDELETIALAGLGPPGIVASLEGPNFAQDLAAPSKSAPPAGGSSNTGNEWSLIDKLLPLLKKGDTNTQQSTGGVPYAPGTTLAPTIAGAGGGISPAVLIGGIAVLGFGIWYVIAHRKGKKAL